MCVRLFKCVVSLNVSKSPAREIFSYFANRKTHVPRDEEGCPHSLLSVAEERGKATCDHTALSKYHAECLCLSV